MASNTLGTFLRHMRQIAAGEQRSDRELLEAADAAGDYLTQEAHAALKRLDRAERR